MPVLKIITINILSDLSHWRERRGLLASGLIALDPDIVAIQEARLAEKTADWLAQQLGYTNLFHSHSLSQKKPNEGIVLISREPFFRPETLDLGSQERVAQSIRIMVENIEVLIVNGHFYWQPGDSPARDQQIRLLIEWVKSISGSVRSIICGDFNGTPETNAIKIMKDFYKSAFHEIHKAEPEYTAPTPLRHSLQFYLRTLIGYSKYIRLKDFSFKWRGTLDYIFVDRDLFVLDSQVVLNEPDPNKPRIYPSDHYGIYAQIEINSFAKLSK